MTSSLLPFILTYSGFFSDARENVYEILSNICKKQGLTDVKRTAYLRALTRLIDESNKGNNSFFMTSEHILRW